MWLQKQLGEEALCQIEQSKICVCMKAVIFMEKKKKSPISHKTRSDISPTSLLRSNGPSQSEVVKQVPCSKMVQSFEVGAKSATKCRTTTN